MKKIILFVFCAILLSSCYPDYVKDNKYNGVYFAFQENVRTVLVGESMQIKVGVALSGVMINDKDRKVGYKLDNSLVTDDVLKSMKNSPHAHIKNSVKNLSEIKALPNDYFSLSHASEFVIPKGEHIGYITLTIDPDKFLADSATLEPAYALPLSIVSADADSVLHAKRSTVIGLKYENMLFGNYKYSGVTITKDAGGNVVKTTPYSSVCALKTIAPYDLVTSKIGEDDGSMNLKLNPDGSIKITKSASSEILVEQDGESLFNKAKLLQDRKLFLKYKYVNADGSTSYASDTLVFQNRIRDGVNEWQDENPENYK